MYNSDVHTKFRIVEGNFRKVKFSKNIENERNSIYTAIIAIQQFEKTFSKMLDHFRNF